MKQLYTPVLLAGLLLLPAPSSAQVQTYAWAQQFSSSPAGNYVSCSGITTDAAANVYTVGWFNGTVDFDPGAGVANATSPGNGLFILKLDAQGNFGWVQTVSSGVSNIQVTGTAISIDAAGNLYATGNYRSTIDFDPGPGVYNLTAGGNGSVFVLKLDAQGSFGWARSIDGGYVQQPKICSDAAGNTHLTGYFTGTVDADPGPGTFSLVNTTTNTCTDAFVIKLDPPGNLAWGVSFGGIQSDYGTAVDVNGAGNVLVTGSFEVTADLNPGAAVSSFTSNGSSDIYILALSANGNYLWAKQIGGTSMDIGVSIAGDATGNVYASGTFRSTVDFDPGPGVCNIAGNALDPDIFVVKLSPEGLFAWADAIGLSGCGNSFAVDLDPSEDVFLCGNFKDSADFDPGPGTYYMCPGAPVITDMFFLKLDQSNGNFIWAKQAGGTLHVSAGMIALAADYSINTGGFFSGTTDFDPDNGVASFTAATPNAMFVHKMIMSAASGIGETIAESGVAVYPNPANGVFQVVMEEPADQFVVTDVTGREVLRTKPLSQNERIDLSGEAPGVYFLRIVHDGQQRVVRLALE